LPPFPPTRSAAKKAFSEHLKQITSGLESARKGSVAKLEQKPLKDLLQNAFGVHSVDCGSSRGPILNMLTLIYNRRIALGRAALHAEMVSIFDSLCWDAQGRQNLKFVCFYFFFFSP
jgi:hypothetical protein